MYAMPNAVPGPPPLQQQQQQQQLLLQEGDEEAEEAEEEAEEDEESHLQTQPTQAAPSTLDTGSAVVHTMAQVETTMAHHVPSPSKDAGGIRNRSSVATVESAHADSSHEAASAVNASLWSALGGGEGGSLSSVLAGGNIVDSNGNIIASTLEDWSQTGASASLLSDMSIAGLGMVPSGTEGEHDGSSAAEHRTGALTIPHRRGATEQEHHAHASAQ